MIDLHKKPQETHAIIRWIHSACWRCSDEAWKTHMKLRMICFEFTVITVRSSQGLLYYYIIIAYFFLNFNLCYPLKQVFQWQQVLLHSVANRRPYIIPFLLSTSNHSIAFHNIENIEIFNSVITDLKPILLGWWGSKYQIEPWKKNSINCAGNLLEGRKKWVSKQQAGGLTQLFHYLSSAPAFFQHYLPDAAGFSPWWLGSLATTWGRGFTGRRVSRVWL